MLIKKYLENSVSLCLNGLTGFSVPLHLRPQEGQNLEPINNAVSHFDRTDGTFGSYVVTGPGTGCLRQGVTGAIGPGHDCAQAHTARVRLRAAVTVNPIGNPPAVPGRQ